MAPWRRRAPEESSLGTSPNQAINCGGESKRESSPSSATSPTATITAVTLAALRTFTLDLSDALSVSKVAVNNERPQQFRTSAGKLHIAMREALPAGRADKLYRGEGDDKLTLNTQNTDIRVVLEQLSDQGGLNILASKNVGGTITASLRDVDAETALSAILKTAGLVWRHEDGIVYVGTPADFATLRYTRDTRCSAIGLIAGPESPPVTFASRGRFL